MTDFIGKLKTLIQWGKISKTIDDSKICQIGQVITIGGKPFQTMLIYPYGMTANAPTNADVALVSMGGSSKSKTGIPVMMENRFRDLKEWESAVGNFKTKSHIVFSDEVEISDTHEKPEDWAVRFSELNASFNALVEEVNAIGEVVASHVHPGVTAGAASTAVTLTQVPSASSEISASRVDGVRLP